MIGPVRNTARRGVVFPAVARFTGRRAVEILGLALFLTGIGLVLALASYDVSDPSWNTAARAAPNNIMGMPGAVAADILVQSVGLAGLLLALVMTVWGWRLMRRPRLPSHRRCRPACRDLCTTFVRRSCRSCSFSIPI